MILVNTSESETGSIIEVDLNSGEFNEEVNPEKLNKAVGLGGFSRVDNDVKSLVAIFFRENELYLKISNKELMLDETMDLCCVNDSFKFRKKFKISQYNKVLYSQIYKPFVKSKFFAALDLFKDSIDEEMDDIFLLLTNSYNNIEWRKEFFEKWKARSNSFN